MSTRSCCERALRAAALAVLVAAGCQREAEAPDAYAARTAVTRYNQALVEAFRTRDQERLAAVASEAERSRVGAIIAGLLVQGRVMLARQTEERVEKVVPRGPDLFEVDTVESWAYEHREATSPEAQAPRKTLTYAMAYEVRRTGDAWVVQHAETREERQGAAPVPGK